MPEHNENSAPKYDFQSPAFFADPAPTFHRMRAEDPVYWHPQMNGWFLTRYKDVLATIRDPRLTVNKSGFIAAGLKDGPENKIEEYKRFMDDWLAFVDPPKHTLLRGLIASAFTPQYVETLQSIIQDHAVKLLQQARAAGQMDVMSAFAFPLPATVIARMLGLSDEDLQNFKEWTSKLIKLIQTPAATLEDVEASYQGMQAMKRFFGRIVEERRALPGDDLVSRLARAESEHQILTVSEVVITCAVLLVGGHETTTLQIGNGLVDLLRHPDQLERLRNQPELISQAVEEMMRYNGAALMTVRQAREDIQIGGKMIRAGQLVFPVLYAANRDPERFVDPDVFDVGREDNRHLCLGHGIHFCLGAALARLELKAALLALLEHLPEMRLATNEIEWPPTILLRGPRALPVTFSAP
jgi:cytochrome P450